MNVLFESSTVGFLSSIDPGIGMLFLLGLFSLIAFGRAARKEGFLKMSDKDLVKYIRFVAIACGFYLLAMSAYNIYTGNTTPSGTLTFPWQEVE